MEKSEKKGKIKGLTNLVTADTICEYLLTCQVQGLDSDRCYQSPRGCNNYQYFKRYGSNWREIGIG